MSTDVCECKIFIKEGRGLMVASGYILLIFKVISIYKVILKIGGRGSAPVCMLMSRNAS